MFKLSYDCYIEDVNLKTNAQVATRDRSSMMTWSVGELVAGIR